LESECDNSRSTATDGGERDMQKDRQRQRDRDRQRDTGEWVMKMEVEEWRH